MNLLQPSIMVAECEAGILGGAGGSGSGKRVEGRDADSRKFALKRDARDSGTFNAKSSDCPPPPVCSLAKFDHSRWLCGYSHLHTELFPSKK
jgi:hypothetical protein